jgi:hypothetical protein
MPSNPKGSCLICRVANDLLEKVSKNIKKNIKMYAFLAIILIELMSMQMQNYVPQDVYAYKIYPTLVNLEFAIIFLAILLNADRLRFCIRQKLIILFLMLYFIFNLITMIFPVCWSDYTNVVNYSFMVVISILFLATWKNL